MSDYLPPDVMVDILSRLPVKSLICFRCVSKSWNSLITSPRFIKIHLNQTKSSKNREKLLLTRYMSSSSPNEQYSLRFDNSAFDEYAAFKCPFKAKAFFRVVGVCNGLICLCDDNLGSTYSLIIWNPAIRRFLELPRPSVNFNSHGPYMSALGFGFDVRKDECKVVRLAYIQGRDGKFAATPKVEIYAVSTGSWRTINSGVPSCGVVESIWSQVFLNGSVHWTGFKTGIRGLQNVLLSFNMADEKFGIVEFPEPCAEMNPIHFSTGLYGDSIALFIYNYRVYCTGFTVYVMKEYGVVESWSKIYTVEMKISAILGFREDGEVLVATTDNELACYEPNCKQTKNLGISGYWGLLYTSPYEESLTLLNELNGDLTASEDSSDGEEQEVDEQYIEQEIKMQYVYAASCVRGFILRS